jgi:hypothetical protein
LDRGNLCFQQHDALEFLFALGLSCRYGRQALLFAALSFLSLPTFGFRPSLGLLPLQLALSALTFPLLCLRNALSLHLGCTLTRFFCRCASGHLLRSDAGCFLFG